MTGYFTNRLFQSTLLSAVYELPFSPLSWPLLNNIKLLNFAPRFILSYICLISEIPS